MIGNVGHARAAGAQELLNQGVRWIACTDADSTVAEDWLVEQLALEADAVCGTVTPVASRPSPPTKTCTSCNGLNSAVPASPGAAGRMSPPAHGWNAGPWVGLASI